MTRLGVLRASPFRFSSVCFFLFSISCCKFNCFLPSPFFALQFLSFSILSEKLLCCKRGKNTVNKQRLKNNHKTLISSTQCTAENIDDTKNLDGISSKICISDLPNTIPKNFRKRYCAG